MSCSLEAVPLTQQHERFKDETFDDSQDDSSTTEHVNFKMTALPKFIHKAFEYSELGGNDDPDSPTQSLIIQRQWQDHRRSLWRWRCATVLLTAALVIIGFKNFASSVLDNVRIAPKDVTSDVVHDVHMNCGNTTKSALSRGCTFHPLSNRWLPGRCNPDHAEAAIISALNLDGLKTPFRFWLDPAGQDEITDWSGLDMGTMVWTTESHHIAHCLSILLQGAGALVYGEMADETARSWAHVHSCAETILTAASALEGWSQINSFFPIQGAACW